MDAFVAIALVWVAEALNTAIAYGVPALRDSAIVQTALLGEENVSNVDLHSLVTNRFRAAELFGKVANIAGDLDGAWLESTAGQPPVERLCATMRYLMSGQFVALRELMTLDREEVQPVFQGDPALLAGHTRALGLLAEIVRQGQAQGSIAADLAPQAVIAAMWALSNLAPRQAPAFAQLDGMMSADAYAEQMLRLFARGLRPPDCAG